MVTLLAKHCQSEQIKKPLFRIWAKPFLLFYHPIPLQSSRYGNGFFHMWAW